VGRVQRLDKEGTNKVTALDPERALLVACGFGRSPTNTRSTMTLTAPTEVLGNRGIEPRPANTNTSERGVRRPVRLGGVRTCCYRDVA